MDDDLLKRIGSQDDLIVDEIENNHEKSNATNENNGRYTTDIEAPPVSINNESTFTLYSPDCPICMVDYKIGDIIAYSKSHECIHCFHKSCLVQWFMTKCNSTCPYCRRYFINCEQRNELRLLKK